MQRSNSAIPSAIAETATAVTGVGALRRIVHWASLRAPRLVHPPSPDDLAVASEHVREVR